MRAQRTIYVKLNSSPFEAVRRDIWAADQSDPFAGLCIQIQHGENFNIVRFHDSY